MTTRWDVTRAVRASDLPAPSRLIMLTLADVAEVGTAEIPEQFTPSISVLAAETGLSKSTVKTHLSILDKAGWIIRERPDPKAQWRGERTRYRLAAPDMGRPSLAPGVGQEAAQVGQEAANPRPGNGPGVGREMALGRPGDGHLDQISSDQSQISSDHSSSAKPPKRREPTRADVDHICTHLADRIEGNGSLRPNITDAWRKSARLLIDKDGRTVDQIIRAIDWCQEDGFWHKNILSMQKLRQHYDRLRLAAKATPRPNGNKPSTTDQRVAAGLALAARLDAQYATSAKELTA